MWAVNKYCTVDVYRNRSKKRPDLNYCCFPVKSDDRKKWEVQWKRADKKFKTLIGTPTIIDPRIRSLHLKEIDISINISGRKNIPSGCYPTIFDPTKAKNTTSARSKRIDNRKRRCAEQPKSSRAKRSDFSEQTPRKKEFKIRISYLEQNLSTEDI